MRSLVAASVDPSLLLEATGKLSSQGKDCVPLGDAKTGPDVTAVTAAKLRNRWLQFKLSISNRPNNIQPGDVVYVAVDSDRKASTGIDVTHATDPKKRGPDYAFTLYYPGGGSLQSGGFKLIRGKQPKSVAKPSTIKETAKAGTWTIAVSPKLFHPPKRFEFFIWTYTNPSSSGNLDFAPDKGDYTFPKR